MEIEIDEVGEKEKRRARRRAVKQRGEAETKNIERFQWAERGETRRGAHEKKVGERRFVEKARGGEGEGGFRIAAAGGLGRKEQWKGAR